MSQNEGKSRKPLIIALIAAVVVLAIVLALVLTMCGGKEDDSTATTGSAAADEYILYWNVDRALYAGQGSTGMSSREPNEDTGYYQITFAMEGRQAIRRVAERRIVNKIDNMDLMGLVLDENGIVIDVQSVEDITGGYAVNKFYVQSVDGNTIVTNSSNTLKGMQVELTITDKTKIYDVSGETGMIGCETTLVELDCVIAIQNKAGEITHIYAVEREPQGPTQTKYCDHCKTEVVWRAWAYDSTLPTTSSGHFYLYNDVQLTTQMSIAANMEIVLDLNGKTVTSSGSGRMYSLHNEGVWLSMMDYSEEQTGKFVVTGTFGAQGGAVWVRYGQFDMYSGTLDASQATNTLNGVAVCIESVSTCNLYGGTWIGGTARATYNAAAGTYSAGLGGTVMCFGTFNMFDGEIRDGKAEDVYATKLAAYKNGIGGNIVLHGVNSVFNMSGGTVKDGTSNGSGGNIWIGSGATMNMSGGTVSGGETVRAGINGGNIYNTATFNISGGTVKNGITRNCGANVYSSNKMTISGGTITGGKKLDATTGKQTTSANLNVFVVNGTTAITGGKVTGYFELVPYGTVNKCTVSISGNPVIYGAADGEKNLTLAGTVLEVGKLTSGAKIGITGSGIISSKTSESNKKYFSVDNSDTPVNYYAGCLCIGEVLENCICGHAHTEEDPGVGDCTGEQLPWLELSGSGTLPSSGNYYLTADYIVTGQVNVLNNTMNLSLNGYNVYFKEGSYNRILQLRTGGVVNLTNWAKAEGGLFQNTQGFKPDADGGDAGPVALVHNYSPDQTYYDLPVLSVYDVTLSARDGDKVAGGVTNGGAVTVYSGTLNLFEGAEVIGGKSLDNGGAINVQGSKAVLNIKGGKVSGGEAYVTKTLVDYTAETPEISTNASTGATNYRGGQGGNINTGSGAVLNLYDGEITGGKANVAGNVAIGGSCTFNMYGGTVSGGEVGNDIRNNGAHGGNIAVFGTLNLDGGVIKDGVAGNGGNISIQNTVAKINMTGGTITNGQALRVIKINDDGSPLIVGDEQQYSGGTGGNIYMFHVGAVELNLNGGVIEKGYAQWDGGNMYLCSPASTAAKDYKIGAVTIRDGIGNKGANIYISGAINSSNGVPVTEGVHTYTFKGTTIENGDGTQGGANFYIVAQAKVVLGEGTKVLGGAIRSGYKANGGSFYVVDTGTELVLDGGIISGGISTNCAGNIYLGGKSNLVVKDGYILNGGTRAVDWINSTTVNYTGSNANIFAVGGNVYLEGGWIDGYTEIMTSTSYLGNMHISGAPKLGDISDEACAEIGIEDMTPDAGRGVVYSAVENYPAGYVADHDYIILDGALTDGALITVDDIGGAAGYPFLTGAATDRQEARDITGYEAYFVHTSGQAANYVEADAGHGELYIGTTSCICGHAHTDEDPGQGECDGTQLFWSPWNSTTSLPDSGVYYLTADVTVNNKAWNNKTLILSMNGYNIKSTSNRPLQLQSGADITITNWTKTTGKITGSKTDGNGGLVLLHNHLGSTAWTADTLKAPSLTLYSVHMDASGITATDTANGVIKNGGAIYAVGSDISAGYVEGLTEATRYVSQVKLYGDTIVENGKAAKGGNIYTPGTAILTMDDNAIIRNGTSVDEGGNVRFDYQLNMSGNSQIYGGTDTDSAYADHANVAMVIVNGTVYGTHLNMSENASIAGHISAWYGDAANLRSYTLSGNVQIVGTKPEDAGDDYIVRGFNWPAEDDLDVSDLTEGAKIMVSANASGYFATGVSNTNKSWIAGCFEAIPSFDAECIVDGTKLFMGKQNCLCGGTDSHVTGFCDGTQYLWKPIDSNAELMAVDTGSASASYVYLHASIAMNGIQQLTLDNGEDVYIDLNGYTISHSSAGRMFRTLGSNGSTLVITNTSDKAASIVNTSQVIDQGGIIWSAGSSANSVMVYNVTMDASGAKGGKIGIALDVAGATTKLFNTTVKGGLAQAKTYSNPIALDGYGRGGAVAVESGSLEMTNCAIIGGEVKGYYDATNEISSGYTGGGAFYQKGGAVTLTNTTIEGGKAYNYTYNDGTKDVTKYAYGGNVYITNGTFEMTGGYIKNGMSEYNGGGFGVEGGATATLTNVEISGNDGKNVAGNLLVYNSNTTLNGCTVTGGMTNGNTDTNTANAFLVSGNVTIKDTTIDGRVEIYSGNTGTTTLKGTVKIHDGDYGLYVGNFASKPLVVDSTFDAAKSDVLLTNAASFKSAAFATAASAAAADGFAAPAAVTAPITYADGKLHFAETMQMCLCGATHDADYKNCDGTKLTWLSWTDTTSLPTSGNWYLTDNVYVTGQTILRSQTLNLSLNGYSIVQSTGKDRVFQLRPSSVLTLTNWGKPTGGEVLNTKGFPSGYDGPVGAIALIFNYSQTTGDVAPVMNVMDVTLDASGSQNVTDGGAIKLSWGTVNLYKGAEVIGTDVSLYGGAIYASNESCTLNIYTGASVHGGTATLVPESGNIFYVKATYNNEVNVDLVAGNIYNCLCGHAHTEKDPGVGDCDGTQLTWVPWVSTTALPADATTNYYLIDNVTINNKNWTVATNIAMNGKNISGTTNRPIQVRKGAKLILTNWTNTTGGIVSTPVADNYGGLVYAVNLGDSTAAPEFYAYNVEFDASKTTYSGSKTFGGGAFDMMLAGNKLGLYNCNVTGSPNCTGDGGALHLGGTGSEFKLEGCTVSGGVTTTHGGNIYISGGTTHIVNCTISGGKATSAKDSGNSTGGNIRLAGTTYISDTTISGGYSAYNSGNIQFGGTAYLTKVTVSGGHAGNVAGNAQVTGTVTMTDCEVYGGMTGAAKNTNASTANLQVNASSFTIDGSTIKGRVDVHNCTNAIVLKNEVTIADETSTGAGVTFNQTNYTAKGFTLDPTFSYSSSIRLLSGMPDGAILVANVAAANKDAVVGVFAGDGHTVSWVATDADETVGNVVANVKS